MPEQVKSTHPLRTFREKKANDEQNEKYLAQKQRELNLLEGKLEESKKIAMNMENAARKQNEQILANLRSFKQDIRRDCLNMAIQSRRTTLWQKIFGNKNEYDEIIVRSESFYEYIKREGGLEEFIEANQK